MKSVQKEKNKINLEDYILYIYRELLVSTLY